MSLPPYNRQSIKNSTYEKKVNYFLTGLFALIMLASIEILPAENFGYWVYSRKLYYMFISQSE